jgi:hypothetical protein
MKDKDQKNASEVAFAFYGMNKEVEHLLDTEGMSVEETLPETYQKAELEGLLSAEAGQLAMHVLEIAAKGDGVSDQKAQEAIEDANIIKEAINSEIESRAGVVV